jgi:hypothetical protein
MPGRTSTELEERSVGRSVASELDCPATGVASELEDAPATGAAGKAMSLVSEQAAKNAIAAIGIRIFFIITSFFLFIR